MENEGLGLHLLKKGQRGIARAIFSRLGLIIVLLLLQFMFIFSVFRWFAGILPHILGGTVLFTIIMVLYLLNSDINPTAKITWLIFMSVIPVFGALFFLYTQTEFGHRALAKRLRGLIDETRGSIEQDKGTLERLERDGEDVKSLNAYINRTGCFPIADDTSVTYFPLGEDKFKEMLVQLEKAEHFIFLEYFIVEEGLMWGEILEILAKKAAEGVDVRVMYDGMCEFVLLSHDYPKRLQKLGIKCKMFSPATPFASTHYNYRDHRKILVIDGHTAFNGGVNLADEYINQKKKFGHWKDTAVMIKGSAVKNFTLMFLQMWNIDEQNPEFGKYLNVEIPKAEGAGGYVMPYGDCPLDGDKVGERVYMDILNRAHKYVHIMTPYLILDGEMETALKFAAERGVDIRIIMPGIPDKAVAYALAKTYYASLLKSGVKIYEYEPGFVHAKVFVSDDCKAVVGTINLDYRSLYHHFECATFMYKTDCVDDIERDYQETLSKCRVVTLETVKKEKALTKLLGGAARVIAPLM